MKTYEATVTRAGTHTITMKLLTGETIPVRAGADVVDQARALIGRKVRFQAQLHESTVTLSSPIFVVGSQYGLQAVTEECIDCGSTLHRTGQYHCPEVSKEDSAY